MAELTTVARFRCPVCFEHVEAEVVVPEPHWGSSDKVSDWTAEDDTEVECPKCNALFAAHVSNGSSGCYITLDEHPRAEIDADNAFYSPGEPDDDWGEDYEPPE